MRAAVALYRDVHGLPESEAAVSPRLLASLRRNAGSVIGAFDAAGTVIGFVYGFLGQDVRGTYHYSQMAAVARDWQGRGVGRQLKLGQRDYVRSAGITRMRWTFDPLQAANGHFNLDVLGAVARWFVTDLYGMEIAGPSAGLPTDRLLVEWDLSAEPGGRYRDGELPDLAWGERRDQGEQVLIAVPRDFATFRSSHPHAAAELRRTIAGEFEDLLGGDYRAVSCRTSSPDTAVYRLIRTGS